MSRKALAIRAGLLLAWTVVVWVMLSPDIRVLAGMCFLAGILPLAMKYYAPPRESRQRTPGNETTPR